MTGKRKQQPPELMRKKGLYLADAGHKGRGVYCRYDIKKGETLEVTPSIILDERDTMHADKTLLLNYTFVVGSLSAAMRRELGIRKKDHCSSVVLGLLTFCNHGMKPNAEVAWEEHEGTLYYILRATRNIPKNTEICTTYGDTWFNERLS